MAKSHTDLVKEAGLLGKALRKIFLETDFLKIRKFLDVCPKDEYDSEVVLVLRYLKKRKPKKKETLIRNLNIILSRMVSVRGKPRVNREWQESIQIANAVWDIYQAAS